jgi:hypothetical protein
VWRGDELIGSTPLSLPKPSGDERLELELRHSGHLSKRFTLSRLTVADHVNFRLERERTRRRPGRRPHAQPAAMVEPAPPPAMMTSMRRRGLPQSEVLDPWAAGGN